MAFYPKVLSSATKLVWMHKSNRERQLVLGGGMDWGAPIVKQMDLLEWGYSGTGKEDICIGTEPQWVSWGQVGRSESPELLSATHAGIGGPLTNSLGDG